MIIFKTQEEHLIVISNFYFSDQGCLLSQAVNAHKEICECIFRSKVECLTSRRMYLIP